MGRLCRGIQKIRAEISLNKKSVSSSEVSGMVQTGACAGGGACADDAPLEDLVRSLSSKLQSSDWLQQNTAEKWTTENPELAKAFMAERSRKNLP